MFDFSLLKKQVNDVSAQLKTLAVTIEAKKQEYEDVANAVLPREEFIQGVENYIDERQSAAQREFIKHNAEILQRPGLKGIPNFGVKVSRDKELMPSVPVNIDLLFLLIGNQMKSSLRNALEMAEYPENVGLPMNERRDRLEILANEIDRLEEQEAQLLQQAEASGLHVARIEVPGRKAK